MKKFRALKITVCAVSAMIFLLAANNKIYAEELSAETGIAGITKTLNDVFSSGNSSKVSKKINEIYKTEINSPYKNLGISIASNYVNIRKKPSTESEIVGKLYKGSAAEIVEWLDGGWVKIVSGDVKGYMAADYLAIGKNAEKLVDKYAEKYATVINTQTLRVREKPSKDARTLELIPLGEKYPVMEESNEWAKILVTSDDDGHDLTGYVHKDYVKIEVVFKKAISIEEEQRIKRMQEEAERAEAERLQKLAEEEEKKRQEEQKKKEEAKKAAESAKKTAKSSNKSGDTSTKENNKTTSSSSGNTSGVRQEIVNYALKFVGYPYVYGGNSLTKGTDCSGFVKLIFERFGYTLERQSRLQAKQGKKISESELRPGDLIFYGNSNGVNHVALYIGDGKIVHAANSRQGIIVSKYNYRKVYCIRNIIG